MYLWQIQNYLFIIQKVKVTINKKIDYEDKSNDELLQFL